MQWFLILETTHWPPSSPQPHSPSSHLAPLPTAPPFPSSLPLSSEMGALKYLQFYNLTCNDCGGLRSNRCLNGTSCTLPVSNCTCPNMQVGGCAYRLARSRACRLAVGVVQELQHAGWHCRSCNMQVGCWADTPAHALSSSWAS